MRRGYRLQVGVYICTYISALSYWGIEVGAVISLSLGEERFSYCTIPPKMLIIVIVSLITLLKIVASSKTKA